MVRGIKEARTSESSGASALPPLGLFNCLVALPATPARRERSKKKKGIHANGRRSNSQSYPCRRRRAKRPASITKVAWSAHHPAPLRRFRERAISSTFLVSRPLAGPVTNFFDLVLSFSPPPFVAPRVFRYSIFDSRPRPFSRPPVVARFYRLHSNDPNFWRVCLQPGFGLERTPRLVSGASRHASPPAQLVGVAGAQ